MAGEGMMAGGVVGGVVSLISEAFGAKARHKEIEAKEEAMGRRHYLQNQMLENQEYQQNIQSRRQLGSMIANRNRSGIVGGASFENSYGLQKRIFNNQDQLYKTRLRLGNEDFIAQKEALERGDKDNTTNAILGGIGSMANTAFALDSVNSLAKQGAGGGMMGFMPGGAAGGAAEAGTAAVSTAAEVVEGIEVGAEVLAAL